MKANICAGEELKKILEGIYKESFVPFNEAMEQGPIVYPIFSSEFIQVRSSHHKVSIESYKANLKDIIELYKNIDRYDELILWFGDDSFCLANVRILMEILKDYRGHIVSHTVNEYTGEIMKTEVVR